MEEKKPSRNYRDLVVWQDSIKLSKTVYKVIEKFPKYEKYGLADQLRRSVVSVPSNIAEGQARKAPGDFRRFLYIALGSLAEIDTQLVFAQEFGYLHSDDTDEMFGQIQILRKKNFMP
jgi:four helix bundle protein